MDATLAQISAWLLAYKYFILFPLVVIEGPIISIVAGYLCSLHIMNIFIVYPVVVVGDVAGDILYYHVGKYGKDGLLGRLFKIPPSMVDQASKIKNQFHEKGGRIMLSAKALHGIGGAFLLAAGMAEMPLSTFIFYNSIGTLIKSLILILVGYFFGAFIPNVDSTLKNIAIITTLGGIVMISFYFFYFRNKKKNE